MACGGSAFRMAADGREDIGSRRKGQDIMKTPEQLKALTIAEFNKAAMSFDGNHAGIYRLCRNDYPDILRELKKESFGSLLDCGCGTGAMLALIRTHFRSLPLTGIDLSPEMIKTARTRDIPEAVFTVGDCEDLPFEDESFDAVICSMSFHHYPHPEKFFHSCARVLRPGGRLILRDMTVPRPFLWFVNRVELPLGNLMGKGDVHCYSPSEIRKLAEQAGLVCEAAERRKHLRLHAVLRKA